MAAAAAALFSLAVLQGVDRWTVDSWYPEIRDLPGIPASAVAALVAAGVDGVPELARMRPAEIARGAGIPPRVAEEAVEVARLAALRGLGAENATALRRAGIGSVCELARAEPARVAAAVRAVRDDPRAGFAPRVRVWVRAAGRACGEDSEG